MELQMELREVCDVEVSHVTSDDYAFPPEGYNENGMSSSIAGPIGRPIGNGPMMYYALCGRRD